MKAKVLLETGQKKLTFMESFASGAVAGTVSTISVIVVGQDIKAKFFSVKL